MTKATTVAVTGLLALCAFGTLSACEEEHRTTKIYDRDRDGDWRSDRDRRYDRDDYRHYDRDDYRYDRDRVWH